jgi:hypothetical protein
LIVAVALAIEVAGIVVTVGVAAVVKLKTEPYVVPTAFVAFTWK